MHDVMSCGSSRVDVATDIHLVQFVNETLFTNVQDPGSERDGIRARTVHYVKIIIAQASLTVS